MRTRTEDEREQTLKEADKILLLLKVKILELQLESTDTGKIISAFNKMIEIVTVFKNDTLKDKSDSNFSTLNDAILAAKKTLKEFVTTQERVSLKNQIDQFIKEIDGDRTKLSKKKIGKESESGNYSYSDEYAKQTKDLDDLRKMVEWLQQAKQQTDHANPRTFFAIKAIVDKGKEGLTEELQTHKQKQHSAYIQSQSAFFHEPKKTRNEEPEKPRENSSKSQKRQS